MNSFLTSLAHGIFLHLCVYGIYTLYFVKIRGWVPLKLNNPFLIPLAAIGILGMYTVSLYPDSIICWIIFTLPLMIFGLVIGADTTKSWDWDIE